MITNSMNEAVDIAPIKGELQAKLVGPRKIIVYWEASRIPEKVISLFYKRQFENLVHMVRIYDVTDVIFTGNNAHHYYDITVPYNKGYWFIKGLTSNRSYIAELGVKLTDKNFLPFLRSNLVQIPKIGNGDGGDIQKHLVQEHQIDDYTPNWIDHVSTYSYYEDSKNTEKKNG